MNIIIYSLIIFVICYLLLRYIANASTKKISKFVRILIFITSLALAVLFAVGGRFLLSLPLILLSLGIIKLKGLTVFQLIGLSLEEAYKILNLDKNKKLTKDDVKKAHANIQKKIHPDISPETSRLSAIVNEAKEVILKTLS